MREQEWARWTDRNTDKQTNKRTLARTPNYENHTLVPYVIARYSVDTLFNLFLAVGLHIWYFVKSNKNVYLYVFFLSLSLCFSLQSIGDPSQFFSSLLCSTILLLAKTHASVNQKKYRSMKSKWIFSQKIFMCQFFLAQIQSKWNSNNFAWIIVNLIMLNDDEVEIERSECHMRTAKSQLHDIHTHARTHGTLKICP